MFYINKENEATYKKIDSETDFPSDSDYDEVANDIPFMGNILQQFQFEPVFTVAEL